MDPTLWTIIGSLGIALVEASYLPQIWRLFRRKEADDVSVLFPGMNLSGRLLATAFGVYSGNAVFAIGFMVGVVIRTTFFGQVVWYRHLRKTQGQQPLATAVAAVTDSGIIPTIQTTKGEQAAGQGAR